MNKAIFHEGIRSIYAAHGKAIADGAILEAIYGRVKDLPDAFMPFAVDYMCNMEKLPTNPGRAMAFEVFHEFLRVNPQAKAKMTACPECDSLTPGFFYADDEKGNYGLVRCSCNRTNTNVAAHTHASAMRIGLQVFRWSDRLDVGSGRTGDVKIVSMQRDVKRFLAMTDEERQDVGLPF